MIMKMQAELWEKLPDGAVRCDLCFRHCRIGLGEQGFCAVRVNEDGRLLTLVGDSVVSISLDPVEKSRSIISSVDAHAFHWHAGLQLCLSFLPELFHLTQAGRYRTL